MKHVLFLLLLPAFLYSQTSVRTESTSNLYKYHSALTAGDTIVTVGGSTYGAYVVGIVFGEPVASDTVIIKNGVGVVVTIVNTTDVKPYYLPLEMRCDTSIIYIQKKASKATIIYRKNF